MIGGRKGWFLPGARVTCVMLFITRGQSPFLISLRRQGPFQRSVLGVLVHEVRPLAREARGHHVNLVQLLRAGIPWDARVVSHAGVHPSASPCGRRPRGRADLLGPCPPEFVVNWGNKTRTEVKMQCRGMQRRRARAGARAAARNQCSLPNYRRRDEVHSRPRNSTLPATLSSGSVRNAWAYSMRLHFAQPGENHPSKGTFHDFG